MKWNNLYLDFLQKPSILSLERQKNLWNVIIKLTNVYDMTQYLLQIYDFDPFIWPYSLVNC